MVIVWMQSATDFLVKPLVCFNPIKQQKTPACKANGRFLG